MIYFDDAATSPMLPVVKERLRELLDWDYLGNAAALHALGQLAKQIVEDARLMVARLINADPEEIIFTAGGSESNNTIINIFAGQKIAVSSIEHPSVLEAAKARAGKLVIIPVDEQGKLKIGKVPQSVDLISVMLANNELGTIQPVAEIVKRARSNSSHIFVHTDATQALGKIHIDVKALDVDYMTLSAHKIGGPLGVGVLYVRKGVPFKPLIYGGHQESKRRAGTSNTFAIAGFGTAAEWCWDNWSCKKYREVAKLRNQLCERILKEVPYSSVNGYRVCVPTGEDGKSFNTLPNILNMSFQAAEGESIQLYLDMEGVVVSTGSACASGDIQPSHVLMATHGDAEVAHSSIRFSLGLNTTEADIDNVMQVLPKIIKRLQDISTIKVGEKTNEHETK